MKIICDMHTNDHYAVKFKLFSFSHSQTKHVTPILCLNRCFIELKSYPKCIEYIIMNKGVCFLHHLHPLAVALEFLNKLEIRVIRPWVVFIHKDHISKRHRCPTLMNARLPIVQNRLHSMKIGHPNSKVNQESNINSLYSLLSNIISLRSLLCTTHHVTTTI